MSVSPIIEDQSIPSSFTPSVERPFDPVGVRWINNDNINAGRSNEHLSDEQVKALIENPIITKSTRLRDLTEEENQRRMEENEQIKIYNMSVKDIAHHTSDTVHDIMDDMLDYNPDDGVRGFFHIFTKSDRLIYVGLLVIVFTIILLLIKTTD
jgi:chromatin segregation and condensation protein Rec8/ScpA/Scc1 (kleisin family)